MKTEKYSGDLTSIKKRKLHDSTRVTGSGMRDHLSGLPDEILCYILSFMTLRDSVRARLLSTRWRYLSDYRHALSFDALNVFGSENAFNKSHESKFVRAVDQFLDIRKGSKLSALKVQFCLGMKQASRIDRWVETGIRMEIKDLELDFSLPWQDETYVLSDQLFHSFQPMPGNYAMTCLKRLDILILVPSGFDLFPITYLLNASPFLETLHLEVYLRHYTKQCPRREYLDCPHLKLKEVKFDRFQQECNELELARYLLKNATALERMVILNPGCKACNCSSSGEAATRCCDCSSWSQEIATTLLEDIKTSAELVILGVLFNAPNLLDNGVSRE